MQRVHISVRTFILYIYMLANFNVARVESSGSDLDESNSSGGSDSINIHPRYNRRFALHPTRNAADVAQQIPLPNVLQGPQQRPTMGPPAPPIGDRTVSHAAQRNSPPEDFLMHSRPGKLPRRTPRRAKKTISQAIEQLHHNPPFWHFIMDVLRNYNLNGIIQKVDGAKFHVGNPEVLSVLWSVAYGTFKTFFDVTRQLEQLQDREILAKKSSHDLHYTFNVKNCDVVNYAFHGFSSTSLETSIIQQISQLQVPLINNEFRMSKDDELLTLYKLMTYLMRQHAFTQIIHVVEMNSDRLTFNINDAGRLAIAWSLLLKSRRTPAYLSDVVCGCDTNEGASIPILKLSLRSGRLSEFNSTPNDAFGYSPEFLQQLSLLCRTESVGLSVRPVNHSSAVSVVNNPSESHRDE